MKTKKEIVFLVAGICMLIACSKSDQSISDQSDYYLKKAPANCGEVILVEAVSGTDITDILKQAFIDAKLAGPGSVVQLPEGEFYLGFIEVQDFFGSFIGAGKGKTIIIANTGLDCDAIWNSGQFPFLIKFISGDVKLNNMTLQTPAGGACSPDLALYGLLLFSDYSYGFDPDPENSYIKASIDNVEFIGRWYNDDFNCYFGLQATQDDLSASWRRSNIDITVTNCTFDTFGYGASMSYIKEGKLVNGTKNNGNFYTNCLESACFWDDINVEISVTDNTFNIPEWSYGLDVDNYPYGPETQTKSPSLYIEGNSFNKKGYYMSIWIHDHQFALYPEINLPMLALIKGNQFYADNAGGGIFLRETQNAVIRNNIFTGISNYGIRAEAYWPDIFNENGLILGNNFSNATFNRASIILDPTSRNWTVVGSNNKDDVINQGINNVITGMNVKTFDGSLGQTIKDNYAFLKTKH